MASDERLRELEEKYENFTVYDNRGSKIGKVDDLFVDEKDQEEYIGVKMGFFGMKSTLIPTEIVRVNEQDRTIEVSESKDHVKNAPSFDDDEDVTADYEERIRSHFGLGSLQGGSERGSYGAASGTASGTAASTSDRDDDTSRGAVGDDGPERSTSSASGGTHPEGTSSSGETERGGASDTDAEYGDHREGEHREASGAPGSGERYEESRASGTTESSGHGTAGSRPSTSKQTEETETFQEGGRTKIRRRIIREEVVDADDQ